MQPALAEWGAQRVSLALDTSMWWHTSWLVRRARVSRGRAIPPCGQFGNTPAVVWLITWTQRGWMRWLSGCRASVPSS